MSSRDAKRCEAATRRLFFVALLIFASPLVWSAEGQNGPGMILPKKAKATLAAYKAAGWIPLQEPDSRFVPGTIFRALPGQFPQWISSLESCGVPKAILKPTKNNSGAFQYNGESVYGASAVLSLPGITAGPEFKSANSAVVQQSNAGASAVDIIKVGDWILHNHASFSDACRSYLSKPNTYVAQESYRVGSGTYALKDKKDVTLNLRGLLLISPSASVTKSGETSLTLTTPVYTAVHGAVYANDLLELMTTPSRGVLNYADTEINSGLPDVQEETSVPTRNIGTPGTSGGQPAQGAGKYYALVIGIDKYSQLPPLETPEKDASDVAKLLQQGYGFQVEPLMNASRDQIIQALDQYRNLVTENDSLLIYYAGHGFNDKELKQAFWLPVDADKETFGRWVSAPDIMSRAGAYRARHVLIISDSCYSGDLAHEVERGFSVTRGLDMNGDVSAAHDVYLSRMDEKKSRQVMSSGGDEPVSDEGCPGHSIFACVLLENLLKPDWNRFTGQDLFAKLQVSVVGRSGQTPHYEFIERSGHDGGDFVFSRSAGNEIAGGGSGGTPIVVITRVHIDQESEKQAVQVTLSSYQDAFDLKDVEQLKKVWPTLTKQQIKNIEKTFDQTTAIKVEVRQPSIQINGTTAVVQGQQWVRYTYQGDHRPPTVDHVNIELAKDQNKGKWLVTAVEKK
jgi:hypothetical protein